jgi:hypothetical protein
VAPTVGFDDDPLGRPEEIDKVTLDQNIHRRRWKIGFPAESEEVDLADGFRLQDLGIHFKRNLPQAPYPLAASPASDDGPQTLPVEVPALICLDEDPLQAFRVRPPRQIEKHPLPADNRYSTLDGHFVAMKPPRLVQPHPRVPLWLETTGLSQHLDRSIRAAQVPELPSLKVRENRPRPTGKHRRYPPPLARQADVAEREDSLKERNEQPGLAAAAKGSGGNLPIHQLPASYNAMLPLRELPNSQRRPPPRHSTSPPRPT